MFRAPQIPPLSDFAGDVERWASTLQRILQEALRDLERISTARDRAAEEPYIITNVTVTRTLDGSTASAADVRSVLATLITDLGKRRILKVPTT